MSQPLYLIRATRRCATHPPGSLLWFTGPRSSIARGWRAVSGAHRPEHYSGTV
ncbi:MAG: hypothetical protein FD152_3179 [Xanthobacteraceae bacterium]|nr:MAG: hypothetical protein FD152_3179 [Xanthobacteraceae bacterium]